MPFYLYQIAYSSEAIKGMLANPSGPEGAAATKLVEGLGGKLHHIFFAFGEYDVVCLIEGPDDKMMAAGALRGGGRHRLALEDDQAHDHR
jgi:uncharacterized protein with GYD domain